MDYDVSDSDAKTRSGPRTRSANSARSLLHQHGHPAVADAFCASRLDRDRGVAFGTLPSGVDAGTV